MFDDSRSFSTNKRRRPKADTDGATLSEIAAAFQVSRSRAGQMCDEALESFRRELHRVLTRRGLTVEELLSVDHPEHDGEFEVYIPRRSGGRD